MEDRGGQWYNIPTNNPDKVKDLWRTKEDNGTIFPQIVQGVERPVVAVVVTVTRNKLKGNVEDIFPQIYRAQRPAVAPANISLSSGEVMEGGSSIAPNIAKRFLSHSGRLQ